MSGQAVLHDSCLKLIPRRTVSAAHTSSIYIRLGEALHYFNQEGVVLLRGKTSNIQYQFGVFAQPPPKIFIDQSVFLVLDLIDIDNILSTGDLELLTSK